MPTRTILLPLIPLLTLAACTTSPPPPTRLPPSLPLAVNNGIGSQFGNYPARPAGETTGPAGERCVLFNWDRPLTRDLAIRLQSSSCDAPGRPGFMVCREISRTVIPIEQSNLRDEADSAEP